MNDAFADLDEIMRASADARTGRDDSAARRARRRRGLIAFAVVLVVLVGGSGGYVAWALNAPLPSPTLTVDAPVPPAGPAAIIREPMAGASAVRVRGGDDYLGSEASQMWLATGGEEPRSIASITKVITALVVLDAHPLADATDPGPTITFTQADHALYDEFYVRGATIAAMPAGSSMSLHDALAAMLIPSASNYAVAVSRWAFGSQSAFLSAARTWLDAHGLHSTTIVEPTGLDPGNVSTPADLVTLAELAAANPAVAHITGLPAVELPTIGYVNNTNGLLGIDGVSGLKTGNLGEGRFALLYTASVAVSSVGRLDVSGVVLDGYSRESVDSDVRAVLRSLRDGFTLVPLVDSGLVVGSIATPWGESAEVVTAGRAAITTWSDTPIDVSLDQADRIVYEDGEVVGRLDWAAGPLTATVDLQIEGTIDEPTAWWRLTNPGVLWEG